MAEAEPVMDDAFWRSPKGVLPTPDRAELIKSKTQIPL